jgi:hypothetical protein
VRYNNFEEYRIRAGRLLKDLRGADAGTALEAAQRFAAAPAWVGKPADEIVANRDKIRRKHALQVVANEAGYRDWSHLKKAFDGETAAGFDTTRLFEPRTGGFLNLWYRSHEEARQVLGAEPVRFLFPFRYQFFVCEAAFLEALGVDAGHPDWERIGYDWVKPRDKKARARLEVRLRRAVKARER